MSIHHPSVINRRGALALLGSPWLPAAASLLHPAVAGAAEALGVRADLITVLYRPAAPDGPGRADPAVQTAIRQLERQFLRHGLKVLQPSAEVYRMMDRGQNVVVTFAADAGFSLVFSAYRNLRSVPQQEGAVAEVRLASQVIVGRQILASEDAVGQMFTSTEAKGREYGERRAFELAATEAAEELASKIFDQLGALTPERLAEVLDAGSLPSRTDAEPIHPGENAEGGGVITPSPPAPTPELPPGAATGRRWALVVGVSDYSAVRQAGVKGIKDLPGVRKDVAQMVAALGRLGFQPENTRVLMDRKATGDAVRAALKEFAAQAQLNDTVLLFFAAHGGDKDFSASGYGMPILADYRENHPGALDFWEIQSFARNLKAQVVWISDTCHSGGAAQNVASVVVSRAGVKASGAVRGPDPLTVARSTATGQNFAILTAASPQEISWETPEGGLFTTQLVRALSAGRGQDPLGRLFADKVFPAVISESRQICKQANQCAAHPQQTPMMAFGGAGDRIVL